MPDIINSPVFGPTRISTPKENAQIAQLAKEVPIAVFQALNKVCNERDLCLLLTVERRNVLE